MARRLVALLGAAAAASSVLTAMTVTAAVAGTSDEVLGAMQRDLGISATEAADRLSDENRAAKTDRLLRKKLGHGYGGSWFDPGKEKLVVAVTGDAAAATARADGAEAVVVHRTEAQLDALKSKLDNRSSVSPRTVAGWYVDVPSNKIVLLSRGEALGAAHSFVAASGVPADAVNVLASTESPRPLIDVVGGNAYYIGSGTRCSVGFSVSDGFVTAGHCGTTGARTTQPTGQFVGSSFPGNDYAYVRVAAGNTPIGAVNNYSGGRVAVAGSQDAPVGSSICRSGSTTGWRCGTIQARNSSVSYPQGTVSGLIRTSACAEPGDSGGSAISGNQAQGVTSGGSGNCRSGGTTYFQPVNEILQTYGLTLLTEGGGNPPGGSCDDSENTYNGNLSSGARAVQPSGGSYTASASGTHRGCLAGPAGSDYDLYLQKLNGSTWTNVASGTTPEADETVSYNGTAGTYRWQVHAYSGSGAYTLGTTTP